MKRGYSVLLPFGDKDRYDLVFETNGVFKKVQCKTARMKGKVIEFRLFSSYLHSSGKSIRHNYVGQVDYFAAYCSVNDKVYLVPALEVGVAECTLRTEKNGNFRNHKKIRWASDYEL